MTKSETAFVSSALTENRPTNLYDYDLSTTTVWTSGSVPGTTSYQVRKGYLDFLFDNQDTKSWSGYCLEYVLEQGEASNNIGLEDDAFIMRKYHKKQMLGISTFTVPSKFGKIVRVPLSQATILTEAGYSYRFQIYSATTDAISLIFRKRFGGRMFWDKVT